MLSNTFGGIKLKVRASDLKKGNDIITEIENSPITNNNNNIILCPNCNSQHLYSGFKSVKSFWGVLSMIISFLFTTYPIYYKYAYKCKDCDTTFKITPS